MTKAQEHPDRPETGPGAAVSHLRLFVAGSEHNSVIARQSLSTLCAELDENTFTLEIVDVLENFDEALHESILVTPALVIYTQNQRVVIFGNLSDYGKVRTALRTRAAE